MPVVRAGRFCTEPGCGVVVNTGRCPEHDVRHRKRVNAGDLHHLYRTARWRRLREQKRRENPFCVDCQADGGFLTVWVDLDHQQPHRGSVEAFWREDNLVGRCKHHHTLKTRRGE